MDKKYDLILIDGNNLAHRCFHTHRDLGVKIDGKYLYTGITYGAIVSILGYVKNYLNDNGKVYVVWDSGRDRRLKIYKGYKASRKNDWKDYENFQEQRELAKKIFPYIGITQAIKEGEEADDLIGTICAQFAIVRNKKVLIVSGDHDMKQLILKNDLISLLKPSTKTDILWDYEYFIEQNGIEPMHYLDVMTLTGDHGDDIPGISGIGEKTAIKLLQEDSLLVSKIIRGEEINLKGKYEKWNKIINENRDKIILAKKLVTIYKDIKGIKYIKPIRNVRKLRYYFEKLKFNSLLDNESWNLIIRMV